VIRENGIRLGQYEGSLLIYPKDADEGLLYNMRRHDTTRLSQGAITALLYDVEKDELLQVRDDNLEKFNQGEPMSTAEWVSKPFVVMGGKPFVASRLDIEGEVFMSLYDGDNEFASADDNAFAFWAKAKFTMKPFRIGNSQRKRSISIGFVLTDAKRLRGFQIERDMRALY